VLPRRRSAVIGNAVLMSGGSRLSGMVVAGRSVGAVCALHEADTGQREHDQ
jgi:hypothetical protein